MQSAWLLFWIVVPAAWLLVGWFLERRALERWYNDAGRLGLEPSGRPPERGLSGQFRGVEVDITHRVRRRYKRSPLISFLARAHIADAANSPEVPEPRAGADLDGSIVDEWFERSGLGYFGDGRLEKSLLELVVAARYASNHPEDYEEEDEDSDS